jgi:hypothetical protein
LTSANPHIQILLHTWQQGVDICREDKLQQ